jgi:hypothetical protein
MPRRTSAKVLLLLTVAALLGLSACDRSESVRKLAKGFGPSTITVGNVPGTSSAKACSSYKAGEDGVLRTFCNGTAVITGTVDGQAFTVSGGSCEASPVGLDLNAGVVTGMAFHDDLPDYVGLLAHTTDGPFSHATLVLHLNGRIYAVTSNHGHASMHGGDFEGEASDSPHLGGGAKVKGAFTC